MRCEDASAHRLTPRQCANLNWAGPQRPASRSGTVTPNTVTKSAHRSETSNADSDQPSCSRALAPIDRSDFGQRGAGVCLPRSVAGVRTVLLGLGVRLPAQLCRHSPMVESMRGCLPLLVRLRRSQPAPDLPSPTNPNGVPSAGKHQRPTLLMRHERHCGRQDTSHLQRENPRERPRPTESRASTRRIQRLRAAKNSIRIN
jgi:hypothetical protein